ncbi:hypothetical protein RUND412_007342 [Rhizina undulata]
MSSQSNSPATLHNDSMEHSTTDSDGSHGLTGRASPSTLSSPASMLDPPVRFEHLESSNHGFDTGAASPNKSPPITPPPRRRTRLDPCVSPGMVEALRVSKMLDSAELVSKRSERSDKRPSRSLWRHQPVRVSKTVNANTAAFTNKRKLSEYENDIEDVRPDPSIPYIPPVPKRTANGEIIDPRIFDGAIQSINGIWMVPRTCNACKNTNHFCNRDSPCESCSKAGRACIRDKGLVSALLRGYRISDSGTSISNQIPAPSVNSDATGADLLGTGNGNIPKNPKKRPRTAHTSAKAREDVIEPESTIVKDYQAGKPPCIGIPPAWCDSRQELCETLPYFRSYQSGCYHHDGMIYGYLLDGFGAPRDYIDGRIIVAHAGGKSGLDENGKRVLRSDQTIDDAVIKSMFNNMRDGWPVAIIIGNQCTYSPAKVPYRYCVLDWFKVVAAWGERESGSGRINGNEPPDNLTYTANFINGRTPWSTEICNPPTPLAPPVVSHESMYDGGDVTRMFWMGMCCPQCGRCNSREFYDSWRCLACDFRIEPPRTIFEPSRLLDAHRPIFTEPAIPSNIANDDILAVRSVRDGLTVMQYFLGNCGTVTHILANTRSNAGPYDADWLLKEYQNPKLPFRRYPLNNHHVSGRLLTQHFTFNCGKPYKFVVDVDSMPFDQSPEVVNKALELIHKRVGLIYPDAEFNEILSVGYFEEQKMGYHDDGEAGLGDTVASISLGAPSRFRFRLKSKYVNETQRWKSQDVNWDMVEMFGNAIEGGNVSRRKKKSKGSTRVKLDLLLSHGDTMIMRGKDIQKYWEHSAVPSGLFRIAVTARQITPEHASAYARKQARPRKTPNNNTHPTPPAHPAPVAAPLLPAASVPAAPLSSPPAPPAPLMAPLFSSVPSMYAVPAIRATSIAPSIRNILAMASNWQQITGIGAGSPENEIRPTIVERETRLPGVHNGVASIPVDNGFGPATADNGIRTTLASNGTQLTGVEIAIGMMSPGLNNGMKPTVNEAGSYASQWGPLNRISSIRESLRHFNVLGYGVDTYDQQQLGSHSLNRTIQPRNSATNQLMGGYYPSAPTRQPRQQQIGSYYPPALISQPDQQQVGSYYPSTPYPQPRSRTGISHRQFSDLYNPVRPQLATGLNENGTGLGSPVLEHNNQNNLQPNTGDKQ